MTRTQSVIAAIFAASLTGTAAFAADMTVGFAIKPSGVPYEELKPQDMVVLDLDGNEVEGSLNPSSDTPTHRRLFLRLRRHRRRRAHAFLERHRLSRRPGARSRSSGRPMPTISTAISR